MNGSRENRRERVVVGNLPEDFLRLSHQSNIAQSSGSSCLPSYVSGTLKITVVEAEFVKNYGLAKMDPYARIRIGHNLYETSADIRGGKHPLWNKTFHSFLPQGIRTVFFDVYDERALVPDERIAWGSLPLPESLLKGEFLDLWLDLSGKQGDGKEGKLHIICNFSPSAEQPSGITYPSAPLMMVPAPFYRGLPYYSSGAPVAVTYQMNPQHQTNVPYTPHYTNTNQVPLASELQQLQEMFPSFDRELIQNVFQSCGHNKDQAINTLLSMNS